MHSKSRKISFWVAGALLWGSFATDSSAADRLRVAYSALNASQSYLWVAQEMGIYRKYGLDVELLYINSGSMNIAALLGGSIQVAGGGPVSIEARQAVATRGRRQPPGCNESRKNSVHLFRRGGHGTGQEPGLPDFGDGSENGYSLSLDLGSGR
jgi:hypothetical protein